MNYFIIILFILFPVFSFAADDEDKKEKKPFILGQSRLDSGAVLGGAKPDSDLVEKAKAGDVAALVQLHQFYRDNGESEKADVALYTAAEKGHIPSLKLIYQKTGEILSAGLEAVINARLFAFAPLSRPGSEKTDLPRSHMDWGLGENVSEIQKAVIYEITDGKKSTLEVNTENASSSPKDGDKGGSSRSRIGHIVGNYQPLQGQLDSLTILDIYTFYRLEENTTQMEYWLGKLKGTAEKGDMLALQIVYRITGEVISAGYMEVVNAAMNNFFEADREKGIHPKMTAMQNLEDVKNSVMERIKAPFVEDKEGIILELYEAYRRAGNKEHMTFWLNKLKTFANNGNILALQVVYHITNEVLSSGVHSAALELLKSAPSQQETSMHPKMAYWSDQGEALRIIKSIITAPLRYIRCSAAF